MRFAAAKAFHPAPMPIRFNGVLETVTAIDALLHAGGPLRYGALILAAALVLDWIVGDMRWFWSIVPHPVAWIGQLTAYFDRKLNREKRSDAARMIRGALVALGIVAVTWAALAWLTEYLHRLSVGWAVEIFLVATLLSQRSLFDHVRAVARGLRQGGLTGGRAAIAHIVGRDPQSLDKAGVGRAAVESLAENFSDGVVAPCFWYALLGLPGLGAYKAINTMDSMIGYRTERHAAFGMAAARLDDLANWIPARLSGALIALAALLVPTAAAVPALKTMLRDAGKHASPNAGWPEAAMAGALHLAVGGPRTYPGGRVESVWISGGKRTVMASDIERALILFVGACAVLAVATMAGGLYLPVI